MNDPIQRFQRFAHISKPLSAAAVLALVLALGASGCKSAPPPDDAAITQAIQAKLSGDSAISAEPIQASVLQGVATLNGTVSNDAARSLAANDVAGIAGVKTVVNNLTVQPGAATSMMGPAPAVNAGARSSKPSASAPVAPPPNSGQQPPAPVVRAEQPPPPPAFRSVTLAAGSTLPVRLNQTLDSATTQTGETFSGSIASDVLVDGVVVLAQGTAVSGRVDEVKEAAHFKGSSLLTIELTSLDRRGDRLPITTDSFSKAGNGRGKNSAEKIGGGAAVGAVLGGIFGGGKGAAIGAAAGGGTGAGVQALTKGQQVQIAAESLVRFHLANPITVRVSNSDQPRPDGSLQRHE